MSVASEFKQFAMRGNVIDLAVGVVIGTAFGRIVSSLVGDIIMPVVGMLISNIDLSRLALVLRPAVGDRPPVVVAYGNFLQTIVSFLIIAITIFFVVKTINRLQRKEEAKPAAPLAPPPPSAEEKLLVEIRDLLKAR